MSIKIMQQVWEHAPVSGGTLLVLLALADSADDNRRSCFPGIESLAHKARLSERQVKRAIAELTETGVIFVERNASPYKTNLYTLRPADAWPRSANMSPTPEPAEVTFATGRSDTHVTSDVTPMSPKPSVTPDEPSDLFGSNKPHIDAREICKESDRFDEFWESFPPGRKAAKADVRILFTRIVTGKHKKHPKTDAEEIIAAVKRYSATGPDPEYTPAPMRWLNEGRWELFKPAPQDIEARRARLMGPAYGNVVR